MPERPSPDTPRAATLPRPGPRWPFAVVACGGLIGAAGVAVGAAGAHAGGGDLTRIAADFLLIHATVLVAGSGVALAAAPCPRILALALGLVAVGAVLFGGELALAGLRDWRPVPLAAPAGGLCLMAGWLLLAGAAVHLGLRRR